MTKKKFVQICSKCGSTNITPYTKAGTGHGEILVDHCEDCGNIGLIVEIEESQIDEFRKNLKKKVKKSKSKKHIWEEITDKYWTKKCEQKLRKVCREFGIFADYIFSVGTFQDIVGREKYWEWYEKLKKKHKQYHGVGPQGFMNGYISKKVSEITNDEYPKIKNKCRICGKKIDASKFDKHTFNYLVKSLEIDSIKDFKTCRPCAKKYVNRIKTQNQKKALYLLKEMYDFLGVIPPSNYLKLSRIKDLPQSKAKKFFALVREMPHKDYYKETFGSWFEALIRAGILNKGVRKLPRGTMCKAIDGHICLSLGELDIDNWLTNNKIKHSKEPKYPLDKDLNPKGWLRADWKIGPYFVEFFGLKGSKDYDIKIELKKELCKKKKLKLIEIEQRDIKDLSSKFKRFL